MQTDPVRGHEDDAAVAGERRARHARAALALFETTLAAIASGRSGLALRAFDAARRHEALADGEPGALRVRAARRRDPPPHPPRGPRPSPGLLGLVALVSVALPAVGRAEPMDLRDRTARWVSVRFEASPADRPGQVDTVWAPPIPARLEPGEGAHEVLLTIPGAVVERRLLRGHTPVPGSFSDFVWRFDATTGHVVSATASGRVVRVLDWGIGRTRMEARIRFEMDTRRDAGFRRPRRLMGQRVHGFCTPAREPSSDCRAVAPRPYDAATGYVNAVGLVKVETPLLHLRTFSALGEAIFSELAPSPEERWTEVAHDARPHRPEGGP